MKLQVAGFTILEVMIAVVILAIGLGALFASEAGAIRVAQKARTSTIATMLGRCKMGEIEEQLYKEGWPGELLEGHDECCEDGEKDGYECDWKVERIKLPELKDDDDNSDEGRSGSRNSSSGSSSSSSGSGGVLDKMAEMSKQGLTGGQSALTDMMSGSLGGKSSSFWGDGGVGDGGYRYRESQNGPIESIVMDMAFPLMKPVIEEGVRRAQVDVKWKEGNREQKFELVQFIVTENQIVLPDLDDDDGGVPNTATNPATNPTNSVGRK